MSPRPLVPALTILLAGCWQMHQQDSVRPHEDPQLPPPAGMVSLGEAAPPVPLEQADSLTNPLPPTEATLFAGRLAYRRYCWPCHGASMDGEHSTVGPSLPRGRLNLLAPEVLSQSDGVLLWKTMQGFGNHPALGATLTRAEAWQTIAFIRAVASGRVPPGAPPSFATNRTTAEMASLDHLAPEVRRAVLAEAMQQR